MRGQENENIEKSLKKIRDEILRCRKCPLYKERKRSKSFPVIGEGNCLTKIMFIGEAPGANEAKTGRPFCGEAGKILDYLLNSVNIKRKEVYITNVLKDRPPVNRNPKEKEVRACSSFLERQINTIRPEIICTLGNYSTKYIFEKYGLKDKLGGISKIHGRIFKFKTRFGEIKIIPFYHPAVAVYNPNMKTILKKDFQIFGRLKKSHSFL